MRAVAFAVIAAVAALASAQPADHGHGGADILFLARAVGEEVAPNRVATEASATAAVIIGRQDHVLRYDLTYHGMESGAPTRIALYNFGSGGNGPTVAVLCGRERQACPVRPSARLTGTLADLRLPPRLLSEFASGRIYLQIDGGNGRPEIRGQLAPNGAMVPMRNFIAQLAPRPGGSGEGTAVLSETYLPGGRIGVEYSVTVAGTVGEPEAVSVGGVPQASLLAGMKFLKPGRLPVAREDFGTRRKGGGSFSGRYVATTTAQKSQLTVSSLFAAARTPLVAVRTSRFPEGELVGVFKPVE